MSDQQSVDHVNDEELVAYLDGELVEGRRQEVEAHLAQDAECRQRLENLERTWQLLDELPSSETNEDFTRSTVAMAAVRLERDRDGDWWKRWRRRLALGGGLAAALALGYAGVWTPLERQRQQQLRDIPVIHDMDLYLHAESVDFLHQLDQDRLFAEDVEDVL